MNKEEFENINQAYNSIFKPNKLSIGLVVPIESYINTPIPSMQDHIKKIQMVENLGFSAIWLRDIPFNVPSFGDVGQIYDPFVYLGLLSGLTKKIALGVASIILPLRHPIHVAKAASSIDQLSNGRLILGIASGDRLEEYPALNIPHETRGDRFRESFEYINQVFKEFPVFKNQLGSSYGSIDMLPKPVSKKVPMLITGASQQSPSWVASNGDGWITYPRDPKLQGKLIHNWREKSKDMGVKFAKPVSQSLYIDLVDDPNTKPKTIHLGYRLGSKYLIEHLKQLQEIGVNHVALNLRFNQMDIETTIKTLADEVLSEFT